MNFALFMLKLQSKIAQKKNWKLLKASTMLALSIIVLTLLGWVAKWPKPLLLFHARWMHAVYCMPELQHNGLMKSTICLLPVCTLPFYNGMPFALHSLFDPRSAAMQCRHRIINNNFEQCMYEQRFKEQCISTQKSQLSIEKYWCIHTIVYTYPYRVL